MYLAYNAPHSPIQALDGDTALFQAAYPDQPVRQVLAAMMKGVDDAIHGISDTLKAESMWEDTITIVMSDNGGVQAEAGIRDGNTAAVQSLIHSNYPLR
jgi:arylsulfatase A-like enzyme